jgi:N-acetylneuraminic acid mutarotase
MKIFFRTLALVFFASAMLQGCKKNPDIPTIVTTPVTLITSTTAVSGGDITDDGGATVTLRGTCWSISENPTTSDSKTSDGNGSGSFSSSITQLTPGTTYFARAFATNSAGTAYGIQVSFTTSGISIFAPQTTGQTPPTTVGQGGTWIQKADFPGEARYGAASFSIGSKAFLGLGYNQNDYAQRDFWEWDQTTNVWTRKADFPGYSAGSVVSFSIGTKGYIGTGSNNVTGLSSKEFWEYDPATNTWTQKASIPTTQARSGAVGFSIGTKGYIGLGVSDSYAAGKMVVFSDFWEWDQSTNVWTKKTDFAGSVRVGAVGFSIGDKGYIGTGYDDKTFFRDFWEWDQTTNVWTRKADFLGASSAFGFSIGNKGYIGLGLAGKSIWEWDQASNIWTQKGDFPGNWRGGPAGFSIGNKGYIGTGGVGSLSLNDLWELTP